MFKICANCSSAHTKPIGLKKRKCPTCGGNVFRAPTCTEIKARDDQTDRLNQFMNDMLAGKYD